MKLSPETVTILQNFSKLNPGIQFKEGNILKTAVDGNAILAKAVIKESFPETFCVYDLNQFLIVHNLNADTELDFDEANIIFKSGRNKTKYRKTASDQVIIAPDAEPTLPSVEVSFTLSDKDYSKLLKAINVLQSPNVAVESDGDKIFITTFDAKNSSAHTNSIEVGDGNGNQYKLVFSAENIKMLPGSYDVKICAKGLAHFKRVPDSSGIELDYWVALNKKFTKYGE